MASLSRFPFRPRLLTAASRLENARSLEEFRAAVEENRQLWGDLWRRLSAEPGMAGAEETIHVLRDARFVLAATSCEVQSDSDITALIEINRQTAERLAEYAVPGSPVPEYAAYQGGEIRPFN